jgi:glycosyltransferase involved in cell wall biosynthesis
MKLLIYLIRWNGGVGRYINNIKPLLEKEGYEVEVISREDDLNCFSTIKAWKKIREEVKRRNFDILYTQDWSCALPFLFYGKNHYCFFHGHSLGKEFLFQYFVGKLMKKNLATADLLNSKIFNCPLIPHGINMNEFRPLGLKREFLGWTNKKTEMITQEDIKELGVKLNMPILIADNIPPEKMNEFYNKCKIFISLPPKQAGCQLSYLEPMAAGVPRIVGNMHGEGYKYPFEKVENFDGLAEAIKKSKKRDYRKWLEKSKFTLENHVKGLIELFAHT